MRSKRSPRSNSEFAAADALGRRNSRLPRKNWCGVRLKQLVEDELAPYRSQTNASVEGPDLPLKREPAQALALALHELVTNAVRHGALSTGRGRVAVRWQAAGEIGSAQLKLVWQECGGPTITSPQRQGFGTDLIHRVLRRRLGGRAELSLHSTGAKCEIEVPLVRVACAA
jgi:two-component sensor histidine kinase